MSKTVLLARPHPFIVSQMMPLLELCGYSVLKPDGLSDISGMAKTCHAAVISLAIVANINATAEEVLRELYKTNPQMPIVFASLLSFDRAASSLNILLEKAQIRARIVGVSSDSGRPDLATTNASYLYLAKDDMQGPKAQAQAKQLLLEHIGR